MCVICHQPKGSYLDKETAETAWKANPEGGGFAYIDNDGKIQVRKHMAFKTFWKDFETTRSQFPKRDYLLHMRIATHGEVNTANVHPFFLDEQELTVVAHNGIISGVPDYQDGRSDTRVFIDEVLPELPDNWLDLPYVVKMVEEWIGWSRLAFLTVDPRLQKNVYILNELSGTEHKGMWFSNQSFRPKKAPVVAIVRPQETYRGGWGTEDRITQTERWWDDRIASRGPVEVVNFPVISEENMKQEMMELRVGMGLTHDLFRSDDGYSFECFGCDEDIDMMTGECACFDKICLDCSDWAAFCSCKDGYSFNLVLAENAPKEVLAKVNSITQ